MMRLRIEIAIVLQRLLRAKKDTKSLIWLKVLKFSRQTIGTSYLINGFWDVFQSIRKIEQIATWTTWTWTDVLRFLTWCEKTPENCSEIKTKKNHHVSNLSLKHYLNQVWKQLKIEFDLPNFQQILTIMNKLTI